MDGSLIRFSGRVTTIHFYSPSREPAESFSTSSANSQLETLHSWHLLPRSFCCGEKKFRPTTQTSIPGNCWLFWFCPLQSPGLPRSRESIHMAEPEIRRSSSSLLSLGLAFCSRGS